MNGQTGLVQADAFQCFHQHAFEVGNLDDLAQFVPQRCHITHLGKGEEPFVLRIVTRYSMKQVDVLH